MVAALSAAAERALAAGSGDPQWSGLAQSLLRLREAVSGGAAAQPRIDAESRIVVQALLQRVRKHAAIVHRDPPIASSARGQMRPGADDRPAPPRRDRRDRRGNRSSLSVATPRAGFSALAAEDRDPDASAAAATLRASLSGRVDFVDSGSAMASVVIGGAGADAAVAGQGPVSLVSLEEPPSVAIVHAPSTISLMPGSAVDIPATLQAVGLAGRTSVVVLEQTASSWPASSMHGRAMARPPCSCRTSLRSLAHADSRFVLKRRRGRSGCGTIAPTCSPWPPPVRPGLPSSKRVPPGRPRSPVALSRPIRRCMSHQCCGPLAALLPAPEIHRPSCRQSSCRRFDVVIVGSPEDLQRSEVDALWQFAARRGGTVVLLPDKAPAGPYAARLPGKPSEHLFSEPRILGRPAWRRAKSFARSPPARRPRPRHTGECPGDRVVAGRRRAHRFLGRARCVALPSRPEVAARSILAQRTVECSVQRSAACAHRRRACGGPARRIRPAERPAAPDGVGRGGGQDCARRDCPRSTLACPTRRVTLEMIRLWPDAETGTFRGEVTVTAPGIYTIRVQTEQRGGGDHHSRGRQSRRRRRSGSTNLQDVPELTGGVAVAASSDRPLIQHLSSLPRPSLPIAVHPLRSAWWSWLFAALFAPNGRCGGARD